MKTSFLMLIVLLCLSNPIMATEVKHNYVSVESEFPSMRTLFKGQKPRIKLLGVLGFTPSVGLEVAVAYGPQLRRLPFGSNIGNQFTLGIGIRKVYKIRYPVDLYYTLSGGLIDRPQNTGVFFQPKIGLHYFFTSRIALNLNGAWTIPSVKAEGSPEQPFSIGFDFQF